MPSVGILSRSFGGGQLPFKAQASVRFLSEAVFERRLTRRGNGQIYGCALPGVLLRRLRFGQRAFERNSRGIRLCQSSAQLRFPAGELFGGRRGFRSALLTGSLEGGRGVGRLPLEGGAGGGVFLQRGVVTRLQFRASRRSLCQLRRVTTVRFLTRGLGGSQFPVETRALVSFLREQVFERCQTLVRCGGAVLGLLIRGRGVGHSLLQRGVCDSVFRHDRLVPCLKRRELRPGDRQV